MEVQRLRAETHSGVQARALPVGLHETPGRVDRLIACHINDKAGSQLRISHSLVLTSLNVTIIIGPKFIPGASFP